MGLKCGIVGLPNVGKSTLFNCLIPMSIGTRAQAANFPFCTIEPNIGVITVPDERLLKLSKLVKPERIVPATVEIVDIAGLVKGASKGEGLGNQFLANIRECDALIHILRCFDDSNVVHVDGSVNPVRDKEVVDAELQLKDLETVEKKVSQAEKRGTAGGVQEAKKLSEVLLKYKKHLGEGKSARSLKLNDEETRLSFGLNLLTAKLVLYVCNVSPSQSEAEGDYVVQVREIVKNEDAEMVEISAQLEAEIAQLESYEDKKIFLQDAGLNEPGVNKLTRAAYKLLNLKTFFTTTGGKEVKAWTIKNGTTALQAAGIIHSDFEKGFIRSEVIRYDDYMKYGSESTCRDAGKLFSEGKEYVVNDGDVIHFKFNV